MYVVDILGSVCFFLGGDPKIGGTDSLPPAIYKVYQVRDKATTYVEDFKDSLKFINDDSVRGARGFIIKIILHENEIKTAYADHKYDYWPFRYSDKSNISWLVYEE